MKCQEKARNEVSTKAFIVVFVSSKWTPNTMKLFVTNGNLLNYYLLYYRSFTCYLGLILDYNLG